MFGSATVQALDDGRRRIATCYEDVCLMWHEHFAKIEAAVDTDFEKLLKHVRVAHDHLRGSCILDLAVVPSRADMESTFRKAEK